jgi:hypothetical protein
MIESKKARLEKERSELLLKLKEIDKGIEIEGKEREQGYLKVKETKELKDCLDCLVEDLNLKYFLEVDKYIVVDKDALGVFKLFSKNTKEDTEDRLLVGTTFGSLCELYEYCQYVYANVEDIIKFLRIVDLLEEETWFKVARSTKLDELKLEFNRFELEFLEYQEAYLYRDGRKANLQINMGVKVRDWRVDSLNVGVIGGKRVKYSGCLDTDNSEIDLVEHYEVSFEDITRTDIENLDANTYKLFKLIEEHSVSCRLNRG